LHCE